MFSDFPPRLEGIPLDIIRRSKPLQTEKGVRWNPPLGHPLAMGCWAMRILLVLLAVSSSVPSLVVQFRPLAIAARRPCSALVQMRAPKDIPARFQGGADLNRRKRASLRTRTKQVLSTLVRVALPTIVATVMGLLYYDNLSLLIRSLLDGRTLGVLMADEAQFVQNFLTVIGLLFSILAGNAYQALYAQQEQIYFALFQEVSEAKSLLEQTTLVGQACNPTHPCTPLLPAAPCSQRATPCHVYPHTLSLAPARTRSHRGTL